MHKFIIIIFTILTIAGCGQAQSTKERAEDNAIFLLFENGGTVPEEQQLDAQETAFHILARASDWRKRRATREAQIYIITSARPNKISWSGTPLQVIEHQEEIMDVLSFRPSFSDLVLAMEQIETTINLNQPDTVRLYWIGPTVHVPFQNSEEPIEVESTAIRAKGACPAPLYR